MTHERIPAAVAQSDSEPRLAKIEAELGVVRWMVVTNLALTMLVVWVLAWRAH